MIGRKSLASFASDFLGIRVVLPSAQLRGTSANSIRVLNAQLSFEVPRAFSCSIPLPSGPGAVLLFVVLRARSISTSVIGPAVSCRVGLNAAGHLDSGGDGREKRPVQ